MMFQPKDESSPWEADCWVLACTQERVISLTREMTGNQDSLPEHDSLNCKSAEA